MEAGFSAKLTAWAIGVIAAGGYPAIFFLMAVENIFPPIPSEVIMGLGGINVHQGTMNFWPLLVVGTLGSTAGNYVWYMVGDKWGYERLRPFIGRWGRWLTLSWRDVEKMTAFFVKHGHWVVFFLRFSPLFRTMISLPAGLAHMPVGRFIWFTMAGSAIWNTALIGAGYYLGQNYEKLGVYLGPLTLVVVVAIVGTYVWRVMTWKPDDAE